ncbi:MAG: uroporphyrinogen-III C-methyltransferase [Candidatus Latescibacterota bacterium]|nr:uroporphyrinogen-III C-methyltransferase [Candidatus Latescibacterota bacterium]
MPTTGPYSRLPFATPGWVYIVGAGPGDPGLLTLKGARYIGDAHVLFHDDLLDRRLLTLAAPDCEIVNVGHRADGSHGRIQQDLNERLIAAARRGRVVVRLKGGDPYIFGRGGEEAEALHKAGIPFEVVSGVSAATGALAYAGIPLTHRGISTTAVLVTGHGDPSDPDSGVDWQQLAGISGTLVIFMGARNLCAIVKALISAGRPAEQPAAAIQWGTYPVQQAVVATLGTIAEEVEGAELGPPTIVVCGDVVNLRDQLNWFESKPLFGRRILVTRSRNQAAALQLMLEAEGADVHSLPLLEITPPDDTAYVDAIVDRLGEFDWVLFNSPNAVTYFFERVHALKRDARAFADVRVAAVGLATSETLRQQGMVADLIPKTHSSEGLAQAWDDVDLQGAKILIPASSIGRTDVDAVLDERGANITRITAYENRAPDPAKLHLPEALTTGPLDSVVFASSSSVRNFVDVLGRDRAREVLANVDIASIGPTTTQAVVNFDLPVAVQPEESSVPSLVRALCDHFQGRR